MIADNGVDSFDAFVASLMHNGWTARWVGRRWRVLLAVWCRSRCGSEVSA